MFLFQRCDKNMKNKIINSLHLFLLYIQVIKHLFRKNMIQGRRKITEIWMLIFDYLDHLIQKVNKL